MSRLLDIPSINVFMNGITRSYNRVIHDDKSINYEPDNPFIVDNKFYWESLFLPIDTDTFLNDKNHKFFGLQYRFYMPSYLCVFLDDYRELNIGVNTIHLDIEIRRLRYYINTENQMCVDKVLDPLYPPSDVDGACMNEDTELAIREEIDDVCCTLNKYYVDKTI